MMSLSRNNPTPTGPEGGIARPQMHKGKYDPTLCLSTSLLTITQKDYNEPQVRYLKSKQASEKTKADEWTASAAVLYCNIYSSNLILSYIHLPVTIISHKLTNPRYLRTVVQLSRGRVWVRPWKANFALSSSPNRSL